MRHLTLIAVTSTDTAVLETRCPFCGRVHTIEVPISGMENYAGGACIQDAFPTLTADERELYKTGICPEWFDEGHCPAAA